MLTARSQACSVPLQDGRVLVAGGNTPNTVTNSVEIYTQNGSFAQAAAMLSARAGASCVTLADGRVYVAGGTDGQHALSTAEIYDPAQNTWTSAAPLNTARSGHTATLLPWGSVLLTGGNGADGNGVAAVELYLPTIDQTQAVGNLSSPRQGAAIAATPGRQVIIAGGTDGKNTLNTIDVYSALDNSIKPGGTLLTARKSFGAATLLDGTVLFTGGYAADGTVLATSEIYDPATKTLMAGPALTTARAEHQSYALPNNGTVLLVGGTDGSALIRNSELFSFQSGKFTAGAPVNTPRYQTAQALMHPGAMVMAGGRGNSGILASSEVYTYATIATDKLDYHPGETANMAGSGFVPGEAVNLVVTAFPLDSHNVEFTGTATADANGRISLGGFNIDTSHEGKKFILTATGSQSVAQQTFTDAADGTTTTITPSVNNQPYGTAVSFHVDVHDTPGTHSPDGNVTVTVDGSPIGTFPLTTVATPDSTLDTSSFTNITPGVHTVVAEYLGSSTAPGFAASNSTSTNNYTVNTVTTTTAITTTQTPVAANDSFTLNATVTGGGYSGPYSGSVNFSSSPSGLNVTVPVSNVGTASYTVPANTLAANTYTITATFTGPSTPSGAFGSSSNNLTQVVNAASNPPATTATVVAASPTGSQPFGTGIIFTATVAASGSPVGAQGTVSFTDLYNSNTIPLGTVSLNAAGQAMLGPISNLAPGSHSVTATFSPSNSNTYAASNGSTPVTITPIAPTFGITPSPTQTSTVPQAFQAMSFTITSSPVEGQVPTGSVSILANGVSIGTVPLSSGAGTLNLTIGNGLAGGTYNLGWRYTNSADKYFYVPSFGSSNTNVYSGYVVHTESVTTTLAASSTTPQYGTPVTLTATVTPANGGNPSSGTVQFYKVTAGPTYTPYQAAFHPAFNAATNTYTATTAADSTMTASTNFVAKFTGDGVSFADSAYSNQVTVAPSGVSTTTVVTSSPSPATVTVGSPISYTATVTASQINATNLPGTVTFYDGGNPIGTCQNVPVLNGSPATNAATAGCSITYGTGTTGTHTITATYAPTGTNFSGSTSAGITATVNKANLTITPSLTTPSPINSGTADNIHLTVTGQVTGLTPAGNYTVIDGTVSLGTQAIGTDFVLPTTLSVGTHNLSINYAGDNNYSASALPYPSVQLVISKGTATVAVAGFPASAITYATTPTVNVTVTGVSGLPNPTGSVSLMNGATTLAGPVTLTLAGTASLTIPVLAVSGSPYTNITVSYSGDNNYGSASSTSQTLTLTKATVTAQVTSPQVSALPPGGSIPYGQTVTFQVNFTTPTGGAAVATNDQITFTDTLTSTNPCTSVVNAGSALCNTAGSSVANGHSMGAANLTGDPNYVLGTVTPVVFNVSKAASTLVLTNLTPSTPNSSPGQQVTFQATASVTAPGSEAAATLAGGSSMTFYVNGNAVCTGVALTAVGGSVQANCQYTFPTAASYNVTASFTGDSNVSSANSNTIQQVVGKPAPTVSVGSGGSPSAYGAPVTFTATVTGANGVTPTGNVQFNDGTNILGTVALTAGTAPTATAQITISNPPLSNGSHTITATYNSDGNYSSATGNLVQVVNGATTNITGVTVSASPAAWGQPVTLSVTVTPAVLPSNGIPTGTVTFYDGGTAISGSPVAIPSGSETATLNGVLLSVGSHTAITAKYNGDNNFASVTSAPATLVVNKAATGTTISSITPAAATYGQSNITITAAVTVTSPGAGTPTGTVTFYDGGASGPVLGSASVSAGVASIQIAATNPSLSNPLIGAHNIVAVYSGDSNFQTSTSSSSQLTVGKSNSTTTVISSTGPSPSQSVVGQTVVFTATVLGTGVGTAPTGTVTFSSNGAPIGSAPVSVNGGVATAVLAVPSNGVLPLPVGTDIISAAYSGDSNYNVSNSPASGGNALQQVVSKAATTTVLTSSSNSSVVGQSVTLTALVTVNPPGTGTPTGTVNFTNTVNNIPTSLGTAQLVPAPGQNASNQFIATVSLPQLPQGNLALNATYSGDNNYLTSTSTTVTQAVSKPAVTITLTNNINPSLFGQPVTFTATVAPLPPGTGTPTGQVTFFDGGNALGNVTLVGGQATLTVTLPVGNHSVAVSYAGDANYQSFVSPTISEIVNKIPSSVSLTSNAGNAVASQVLTFTAQIGPIPPAGVPYPTGQVAFFDGSNQIGVGQLSSGVATFSTAQLTTGLHYISAVYAGDNNWTGTTSAFVPQNVTLAQTATQLVSSANPSVYGQPVTFTISVSVGYPGTVPANGQVQLFDNTVALGQPANIANGATQVTIPSLAPGTHNIIAQYVGNFSFATSNSAPVSQTVNKAPTVTTLAALPNDSTSNQQVTLTAVVTVPTPGAGIPTGTVQFTDTTSNTVLGTASLTSVGGVFTATLATSQLNQAGAPRLLTATYSGDTNFASSTSQAQPQTVLGTEIAVTNAAGYGSTNFSPDGAAAIFVDNLVNTTVVANTLPLPQSLAGVTVTVADSAGVQQQAALYFVSPTQINFLMPTSTAFGLATVTVTNSQGATASGVVLVTHTAPGIFTANQNGQGVAQAVLLDVTQSGNQTRSNTAVYNPTSSSYVANPIAMNSTDSYYLELYGTGIRYATGSQVTATINGQSVQVLYAGAQPQYPGLDQVDIQIPSSLKGAGTVNVVISVNGQAANTVTVSIQ